MIPNETPIAARRLPRWNLLGILLALVLPIHGTAAGATPQPTESHWAFDPLTRPPVPDAGRGWGRNPIDRFVAAALQDAGISPAPEAPRRTLYRRLHFDLLGLPPDPAGIDAFETDPDPLAYERLVDRLLASPRYGERWARHWLDVAHYGETHGYDKDKPRENAWPYRDYVVRSLNADRPYARFVQEQVAGDALWPGTEDGHTALGFIAAGPWDFIGHAEVPESKVDGQIARMLDRDDMVANVMNTFCSLTVQCARCHDHKADPVPQEDYYRLTAVFAALDRADRRYDADPAVARRRTDLEVRRSDAAARSRAVAEQVRAAGGPALALLDRLREELSRSSPPGRPESGWHGAIAESPDEIRWVQVDLGQPVAIGQVVLAPCHDDFNGIGAGFGFPPRYRVEASDDPEFATGTVVLADRTQCDQPAPGIRPVMIAATGITARHVRVTATRLAPRKDDFIFALAELGVLDAAGRNHALGAPVTARDSIEASPRWARANLTDGYAPDHAFARSTLPSDVGAAWRAELAARVGPQLRQESESAEAEVAAIEAQLASLPPQRTVYAATVHHGSGAFRGTGPDGGRPRTIHVLARGDVRKPRDEVGPGTVAFVTGDGRFSLPPDAPESDRRVALARWLTDPGNPLPWRSIVNRVWHYHFGRGLVDTPNDFGRMGARPSHPELLDWLAVGFRDGSQSLKELHRLILTSATYRQAVAHNARGEAVDADNRLLWRQNRRKLEAEAVRDSLLTAAGRLDHRMGGPSFRDFVVEKPEHSPHYEYGLADPDDPSVQRRSIYRMIVRSQPQPFLATLDCADPSMSVDRRNETLSPLQALSLLNNRLVLSAAGHFARRVAATPEAAAGDPLLPAFRWALGRGPTDPERSLLTPHVERHGLESACRLIFNLNEFTFVD